jgi:hypothetical protein
VTPRRARFHGTSPGCSLGQCQLDLRIVAMERSMKVKTTCSIGAENDYLRHVSTISENSTSWIFLMSKRAHGSNWYQASQCVAFRNLMVHLL